MLLRIFLIAAPYVYAPFLLFVFLDNRYMGFWATAILGFPMALFGTSIGFSLFRSWHFYFLERESADKIYHRASAHFLLQLFYISLSLVHCLIAIMLVLNGTFGTGFPNWTTISFLAIFPSLMADVVALGVFAPAKSS